ncbi:hypothetical protein A9F13_15g01518 [Clavispora lusitaniae]|uniref:Uncharacterized protein n=1 Tax=Clavispora lusitaniae TaxID=36911 RepID=A0AA91PY87_CLALS|nr:hypothetical protein A9F13_15g01518 [Clavispora lusitaniae]
MHPEEPCYMEMAHGLRAEIYELSTCLIIEVPKQNQKTRPEARPEARPERSGRRLLGQNVCHLPTFVAFA